MYCGTSEEEISLSWTKTRKKPKYSVKKRHFMFYYKTYHIFHLCFMYITHRITSITPSPNHSHVSIMLLLQ